MKIRINNREIGDGEKPFIIAEAGINHNGDVSVAKKLVDSAKECGADAIKFQSFSAEGLLSRQAISAAHTAGYNVFKLIRGLELSGKNHKDIAAHCRREGMVFLSTPLDFMHVDLLDEIGVGAFKIASMDVNNLPLLKYVSGKNRPIILSTGMADMREIEKAVATIKASGNGGLAILHCVSLYPPSDETLNLSYMAALRRKFKVPVGFSDHTLGTAAPIAAMALGASIIEKHFTLDKGMPGPDQKISANPAELRVITDAARRIPQMLGGGVKRLSKAELGMRKAFRRSVVARRGLKKGDVITEDLIDYKRPGTGIPPSLAWKILGRKLKKDVDKDDIILWSQISG